jgi:hypothetical protein
MSKIDLPFLLIAYLLRLTQLFLFLYATYSSRLYNYWFHTNDVLALSRDPICWAIYIFPSTTCFMLQDLHILLKLIVGLIQLLPFWAFLSFWPHLYLLILTNPKC